MTSWLFIILLTICGIWNVTDGWFSLSLYLKNKDQTWYKDHYIRVIRILVGLLLIWLAMIFGKATGG